MRRPSLPASILALTALSPSAALAQETWRGDFETEDTSQWDNELNGMVDGNDQITIVDDPVIEGSHAVRIALVDEARWPNGLRRVELHHSPDDGRTGDGEELWFAWSLYVPETLPTTPETQIGYWETDASYSQLMAFTLIGTDLRFSTNHPEWREQWRGEDVITPGQWHRIAMHVLWSTDEEVGTVDLWLDGEQVVTEAHAATLVDGNSAFVQLGMLRGDADFDDDPVIFLDDAVEGDSLASVRPDALSEAPDAGVTVDGGVSEDAGAVDASGVDAARADAGGRADAGSASTGGGCQAARGTNAWPVSILALVVAALTRRSRARAAAPR